MHLFSFPQYLSSTKGAFSQDHWVVVVGSSGGHLLKPLRWSRLTWRELIRTMSRQLVSSSTDVDSVTTQGNLFPCILTVTMKLFSYDQEEPAVFQSVVVGSCPVSGNHWKEPGSVLFTLLIFRCWYTLMTFPLSLLFSRLHSRSSHPFL